MKVFAIIASIILSYAAAQLSSSPSIQPSPSNYANQIPVYAAVTAAAFSSNVFDIWLVRHNIELDADTYVSAYARWRIRRIRRYRRIRQQQQTIDDISVSSTEVYGSPTDDAIVSEDEDSNALIQDVPLYYYHYIYDTSRFSSRVSMSKSEWKKLVQQNKENMIKFPSNPASTQGQYYYYYINDGNKTDNYYTNIPDVQILSATVRALGGSNR